MAKTLRSSGDFTIKAGNGFDSGSGTNTISLDCLNVSVTGNLTVGGSTSTINTTNTTIEDNIIELNRNISNNAGSPTELRAASNSDDAIIGIRCVNKSSSAVTVTVQITDSGSTTYNVISAAPIPVGGSLELIDGGKKNQ